MERERQLRGMLVVCVIVALCPSAWARYGGGSGTASDPYLIYTAEHLRDVSVYRSDWRWDVHYKLMADIDLAELAKPIEPMGTSHIRFMGDFDGNGKMISNLKIAKASGDNVGLFAFAEVRIHDLGLIDVEIDAPQSGCVGALVGRLAGGRVERCFVQGGTVSGAWEVGGLIGHNGASVSRCRTACSVSGNDKVGGLLGWHQEHQDVSQCYSASTVSGGQDVGGLIGLGHGVVKDCYATGDVRGVNMAGGLLGNGMAEALVWNCYAAARVLAQWNGGGLVGGNAACFGSFWDIEAGELKSGTCGTGKTTAQMRTAATFRGWDHEAAWTLDEGADYPRLAWESRPGEPLTTPAFPSEQGDGTAQDPYLIRTAAEIDEIGDFPGEWDKHYRLESDIDLAELDEPFRMIGRQQLYFTGTFDGHGHSISNLHLVHHSSYVGFFGFTRCATIRRLTLIRPRVELPWSLGVGTLIGEQVEGTVQECAAQDGSVLGAHFVGGLVGRCTRGTVTRCYSTCAVTSREYGEDAGGLIGRGDRCNVNNSYAAGAVEGQSNVGGLIGRMDLGNVNHCYSTGSVAGVKNAGGMIGLTDRTLASACFWDIQTSGQQTSAAGTGVSTIDLQKAATFLLAGWDFAGEHKNGTAEIWAIDEGKDYPRFSSEPPVPPERVWADDFEDGAPAPLWQVYEPDPDRISIREIGGKLEMVAPAAPADRVSAAYLSAGWALDGLQDFSLRVDFHFTGPAAGEGQVSMSLVPSPAAPIGPHLEYAAGCLDNEPVHRGSRADGVGFATWWGARGCDNGTLYVSYDAAADELYLSDTGHGPANAWRTVTGLLKDRWAGGPVYVVLAGSSEGMAIKTGEAWLDNFAVDTGAIRE